MSGIYIPSMEMPTTGHITVIEINCLGGVRINGKPIENKAVPVPDHGRLIDADALIEKCEEMADDGDGNQLDALVFLRWFFEQKAPTIIPASTTDKEGEGWTAQNAEASTRKNTAQSRENTTGIYAENAVITGLQINKRR